MSRLFCILWLGWLLAALCLPWPTMAGQDMRELSIRTRDIQSEMEEKAATALAKAREADARSRTRIMADREQLTRAVTDMEERVKAVNARIKDLTAENDRLTALDKELTGKLDAAQGMVKELSGVIRMNAKDIAGLVDRNFLAGVFHPDTRFLKAVADASIFPGMDQIRQMAALLTDQIRKSAAVCIETCPVVDRSGRTVQAKVLVIGGFTAAYRLGDETGFLNYTPGEKKLYALSRLPASAMKKNIDAYMDGRREAVPMDISRGGALTQLTHELSLLEQVPKGGPIVWPILAILALGGLIFLERLWFMLRRKIRLETVCVRIETLAGDNKWEDCGSTCDRYERNPVIRVIRAGIGSRDLPREDMENAVQEAILKEIPPMERFLSTLGMLAAIAPLLGLLGTVTGMINTFHVITMHGTGDPRLMSGGISEALVTTMLGLAVAIPIMLAHTLLSRAVENTVGLMEEKAVALINIVQRIKEG